jgi:probable HAF family extracellular repeat protein
LKLELEKPETNLGIEMTIDPLGVLPSALMSWAHGLNQNGQIVGDSGHQSDFRPFLWQDGNMVALPTLGQTGSNSAQGINDLGHVVGWIKTANGAHACIWQNGKMFDLEPLGGTASRAFAINNQGQVVGRIAVGEAASEGFRAFLCSPAR